LGQQRAKSAFQALIRARKRPKTAGESSPRHKDSLAPANRADGLALGGLAGLKSHREGPKCRWFTATTPPGARGVTRAVRLPQSAIDSGAARAN
jgi:hypothetical protein